MNSITVKVVARWRGAHDQAFVKVNAPIDAGVASVVASLSLFPKLCTISSSEGNVESHGANVRFRYAETEDDGALHESADFFVWFAQQLSKLVPHENHRLTAEALAGRALDFTLSFDNRMVGKVAQAIREIARQRLP